MIAVTLVHARPDGSIRPTLEPEFVEHDALTDTELLTVLLTYAETEHAGLEMRNLPS